MKKNIVYAFLLGALALAGCNKDDNGIDMPPSTPEENLKDSVGTATRPTDWTAMDIALLDPTTADRIVVTQKEIPVPVDLEEDLMGAFVDGECRDVSSPQRGVNGQVAFTLMVLPKVDEPTSEIEVELRYYSQHNKRIYVARPFNFDPGYNSHGSLNGGGYAPQWK